MRAYDTVYKVDGQAMLAPDAGVELGFSDLDAASAGRDEAGFLHRRVLRRGVRTWGFTYATLTAEEYAYLTALFAGKDTFQFACEDGAVTAYCAKRQVRLYSRSRGIYQALQFNIIEC